MTFTMQMEVVTYDGVQAYSLNADASLDRLIDRIREQITLDSGVQNPAAVTIIIQGGSEDAPA